MWLFSFFPSLSFFGIVVNEVKVHLPVGPQTPSQRLACSFGRTSKILFSCENKSISVKLLEAYPQEDVQSLH